MGEVERDESKAVQWFREAADKGNPRAQFLLAEMLIKGKGTQQDRAQGMEWLQKSANQGFEKAQNTLKSSQD
jgi:TPR repeat protein